MSFPINLSPKVIIIPVSVPKTKNRDAETEKILLSIDIILSIYRHKIMLYHINNKPTIIKSAINLSLFKNLYDKIRYLHNNFR